MSKIDPASASFDEIVPTESNYLKKEDLDQNGVSLTISHYERLNVAQQGTEMKTVVFWMEGAYKPCVLNQTRKDVLKAAFGDPASSIGKQINVYNDPTIKFGTQITGGIGFRPVPSSAPAAPAAGPEDDVPF